MKRNSTKLSGPETRALAVLCTVACRAAAFLLPRPQGGARHSWQPIGRADIKKQPLFCCSASRSRAALLIFLFWVSLIVVLSNTQTRHDWIVLFRVTTNEFANDEFVTNPGAKAKVFSFLWRKIPIPVLPSLFEHFIPLRFLFRRTIFLIAQRFDPSNMLNHL